MSEDGKTQVAQTETGAPVKRSKKKSCMRHCKRFWWIYLIVTVCVIVLVVCLIIFVGVPKIAQDKVDEAKLEMQGTNMLDTTSDSYYLGINGTLTTDGSISADVAGFHGVMYLEDLEEHKPFVRPHFPKTNGDKHQTVNISEPVTIEDLDAFTEFNVWFFKNETLRVSLEGDTTAKPSGLTKKYDVNFKKTVEIKGINQFKGTKVTGGKISLLESDDGRNFHGTADIPNASEFTLDIGNVTFDSFVEGTNVGELYLTDFILHPGINSVNISASINQTLVLRFLGKKEYCDDGKVPFQLLGKEVKNHGQELSYFSTALGSANQTVEMDLWDILGYEVDCSNSTSSD